MWKFCFLIRSYYQLLQKTLLMLSFMILHFYCISNWARVFANGPGDRGSVSGRVIPKTLKMILPCLKLSNIRYVSRVKWRNPGKGVASFNTPRCCSYWKGSLLVTLDYSRQLYLLCWSIERVLGQGNLLPSRFFLFLFFSVLKVFFNWTFFPLISSKSDKFPSMNEF